jgi:hypothetical protein
MCHASKALRDVRVDRAVGEGERNLYWFYNGCFSILDLSAYKLGRVQRDGVNLNNVCISD